MATAHLHLTFPPDLIDKPVIHTLGQRFDLVTNIRRANIGEGLAWVILELQGAQETIQDAVAWLVDQGVHVDRLEDQTG